MKATDPSSPRGGFALVVALLVLALLVVTVVGTSLLLQVEVRTADNSRQISEARENALFGLDTAIGELQQLAGPDRRVTATASLTRNATDWSPANNVPDTSPHRNWTGVWDAATPRHIPSGTTGRVVSNVGTGSGQLNPEPLAWLVSGGKNRNRGSGNSTETSRVTPGSYPARIGADGRPASVGTPDDHVVLVGNGSVDLAAKPEDGIVVPKAAIISPRGGNATARTGSYAFWVGDEGVKARFDAVENAAFESKPAAEKIDYRVLGAQRIGAEQINTGSGNVTFSDIGYDPLAASFLQKIRNLATREQIAFLDHPGRAFHAGSRRRFHDITASSEGVLVDVRKGGLKQDLTVYLQGSGTISANGTTLIADTDTLFSDPRDTSGVTDPRNPRAPLAIRYPGLSLTSNSTGLPKFGLLRSWHQMNAASPAITPRTTTEHGLYPVIVRCEWPIWVNVNLDLTGATFPFPVPAGAFTPRVHPTVTLWNPYNVDLPAQEYLVEIPVGPNARFGFVTDPDSTIPQIMSGPVSEKRTGGVVVRAANPLYHEIPQTIRLRIPADEGAIPAGQTKIYTLGRDYPDGNSTMDLISAYFTISPATDWSKSSLDQPPKATNSNFSFGLGTATGPNLVVSNVPPVGNERTLLGVFAHYSSGSPQRVVRLIKGAGGDLLQTLTPSPDNYTWLSTGYDQDWVRCTAGSFINFASPNTFSFDTRKPFRSWQARPLSHYVSGNTASLRTGGSFASMLDYDYRVATAGDPPNEAIGGRESVQWSGPYRFFPDGSNSDTLGVNQNLFSFGASPASERFFYAYPDTLFKDAQAKTGSLVSTAFSANGLGTRAPLFDLKPAGRELVSLGYLQHVNLASHIWQPSYPLGNSWVNPQLAGRDFYAGFFSGAPAPASDTANKVYDLPLLANEAVWDRFFLSGVTTSSLPANILNNSASLPNSRLQVRTSLGADYNSTSTVADRFETGARFFLTEGAFNINSTSVEAWKAFLSSRNGLSVNGTPAADNEAVFARMLGPGGGNGGFLAPTAGQPAAETASAYTGARKLSEDEVRVLAEKIVEQVKLRGPFTSLADFVNRRLPAEPSSSAAETDITRTGFMGALQAAIDAASEAFIAAGSAGINSMFYNSALPGSFFEVGKIPAKPYTNPYSRITSVDEVPLASLRGFFVPRLRMLGKYWYYSAAGVPGFLTQADILSGLGHLMAARSDTFVIRAYGETLAPSGKIAARAWCEAVVQRVPEPLKANPTRAEILWPENPANTAIDPMNAHGRKFIIKSFRWLTPEEV